MSVNPSAMLRAVLVVTAVASCVSDDGSQLGSRTEAVISDAVHTAGNPGFYFLPPMVPEPTLEGTFARQLAPVVRIDEHTQSDATPLRTIATFTTDSGTGTGVVHNVSNHQYHVNWRTRDFDLSPSLRYRINVLLDGRVLGFADVDLVNSGNQLKNVDTQEYIPLLDGQTLPIKFWLGGCALVTCQALDQCHDVGVCNPIDETCSNPVKANGATCSDGDACTQTDSCQAGACTGASPVTCTASDQCHVAGTCDSATGACSDPTAPEDQACDDGDACTQVDSCLAGICNGEAPITCTAVDACHAAGVCDSATGVCSSPDAPDGTSCGDGNACTQTDTCQAGACTGTNPVVCAASDQCHVAGTCDSATGACDNPEATNGTACSDGDACTQTDSCQAGACAGASPVVCVASDQCHVPGTCDPASGACSDPAAPEDQGCDDGDACTLIDSCLGGTCNGEAAVTCTASDQCHVAGTCEPTTGVCDNPVAVNGASCGDGNACTRTDTCQAGACTGANPVECTASDECHRVGTCDPANGACTNPDAANGTVCSDGDACSQTDSCQAGACTGTNPVDCTASDECHVAGTCDPANGTCSNPDAPNGASCNDTDGCSQTDSCQAGACVGANPVSDCQHGGVCVDAVSEYTCDCPAGFTGLRCEIDAVPVVGGLTAAATVRDAVDRGNTAWVALDEGGVGCFDLTNPDDPTVITTWPNEFTQNPPSPEDLNCTSAEIVGDTLAVACGDAGIILFDLAAFGERCGLYRDTIQAPCSHLTTDGNLLYAAVGDDIRSYGVGGGGGGGFGYVGSGGGGGFGGGIAYGGGVVWYGGGSGGYGGFRADGSGAVGGGGGGGTATGIFWGGGFLGVAFGTGGLWFFDVTDPYNHTLIRRSTRPAYNLSFSFVDHTMACTHFDPDNGQWFELVVDLTDPYHPNLVSRTDTGEPITGVASLDDNGAVLIGLSGALLSTDTPPFLAGINYSSAPFGACPSLDPVIATFSEPLDPIADQAVLDQALEIVNPNAIGKHPGQVVQLGDKLIFLPTAALEHGQGKAKRGPVAAKANGKDTAAFERTFTVSSVCATTPGVPASVLSGQSFTATFAIQGTAACGAGTTPCYEHAAFRLSPSASASSAWGVIGSVPATEGPGGLEGVITAPVVTVPTTLWLRPEATVNDQGLPQALQGPAAAVLVLPPPTCVAQGGCGSHGQCVYLANNHDTVCQCDPGWSGGNCGALVDGDLDGTADGDDNCPSVANAAQTDSDGDLVGDACDADDDNDGVPDASDNCPTAANPDQLDTDRFGPVLPQDGLGDACDPDDDDDGIADGNDTCPLLFNTPVIDTSDPDGDGLGNACDADDDNDGVLDASDNCRLVANPGQANSDGDLLGDACDPDADNDGVIDALDNCPLVANAGQANADGDAFGDACDSDADNDGVFASDNCPLISNPAQTDTDGDGIGDACETPTVGPLGHVIAIGRDHTCMIYSMGLLAPPNSLFCWGGNDYGQLAQNPALVSSTPIYTQLSGVVSVAAGMFYTCALKSNGEVWCWGANGSGQLGRGTISAGANPTPALAVSGAVAISASVATTCAALASGQVKCWGTGSSGQIGNGGSTQVQPVPTTVIAATGSPLDRAVNVAASGTHVCAVQDDGDIWCWGSNTYGQCGSRLLPLLNVATAMSNLPAGFGPQRAISATDSATCSAGVDGRAWCWGLGSQVGVAPITNPLFMAVAATDRPQQLGLQNVTTFEGGWSHTCAVASGSVYCWGSGPLGQGPFLSTSQFPVLVGGVVNATDVAGGPNSACALSVDGSAKCWSTNFPTDVASPF